MMGSRSSKSGILGRRLVGLCGLDRPAVDVSLGISPCSQGAIRNIYFRVNINNDIVAAVRHPQD